MGEPVGKMLGLQKSLLQAKTDHEKTLLERQIKTTDNQIDKLVYELYGLSDDEIAIVEGTDWPDGVGQRMMRYPQTPPFSARSNP